VDVIASHDRKDLAIDRHLTLTLDDVVVLIVRTEAHVTKVMGVNAFAGTWRNVVNDEVGRRGLLIEGEEADANRAIAAVHIGVWARHVGFAFL
jgi:hypothetical protein